ncbi:MAG: hypothetical protein WC003_10660 [Terrimicrobiaceae bacterium]
MNTLLAAAATDIIKLETAVLLLVMAGLLVLAKIVSDLKTEVRSLRGTSAPENKPHQAPSPAPACPPQQAADGIAADVFTAIVGAVYCTLGDHHRIVSVTPDESLMWSREGRRSIFRSHTFR